jgi:hypothetical protein
MYLIEMGAGGYEKEVDDGVEESELEAGHAGRQATYRTPLGGAIARCVDLA